jgi:hypothetical protein
MRNPIATGCALRILVSSQERNVMHLDKQLPTRSATLRFKKKGSSSPKPNSKSLEFSAAPTSPVVHIKARVHSRFAGESVDQPLGRAQVPCLSPRRRPIEPAVQSAIESWIRAFLSRSELSLTAPLEMTGPLEITEWVSMDSRATPHALVICLNVGHNRCCFTLHQASERVVEADLILPLNAAFPGAV